MTPTENLIAAIGPWLDGAKLHMDQERLEAYRACLQADSADVQIVIRLREVGESGAEHIAVLWGRFGTRCGPSTTPFRRKTYGSKSTSCCAICRGLTNEKAESRREATVMQGDGRLVG